MIKSGGGDASWLFGEEGAAKEEELAAVKPTLIVNEKFAARFEQKNRDMHIARLEAEVEALDLSIESEDEEEDEIGELVTGDVAGEFLEVYSRIREHDPALYDSKTEFFKQQEEDAELPQALVEAKEKARAARPDKKQKRTLLEAAIIRDEDEEDVDLARAKSSSLSIAEQDQELKKSFQKAFFSDDEAKEDKGDQEDEEELLVEKPKSRDEELRLEEEYKRFLDEKKRDKLSRGGPAVRAFWAVGETAKAAQLSEGEHFLRRYILENGWVDEEAATRRVAQEELDALSASEEELDRADEFEARVNFRHEEPGAAEGSVRYPRDLPSVRALKPSTRQKARERTKESKRAERERLANELKQLKAAKRKQMLERMQRGGLADDGEDDMEQRMLQMNEEELEQFMDEYLKLDYQGTVGDVKMRFKYVDVKPDSFGLEEEEILQMEDEALEKFVPMHALAPYREGAEWKPSQAKRRELRLEQRRMAQEGLQQAQQEEEGEERRRRRREEKREKKRRKKRVLQKEEDEKAISKLSQRDKSAKKLKKKLRKKQKTLEN